MGTRRFSVVPGHRVQSRARRGRQRGARCREAGRLLTFVTGSTVLVLAAWLTVFAVSMHSRKSLPRPRLSATGCRESRPAAAHFRHSAWPGSVFRHACQELHHADVVPQPTAEADGSRGAAPGTGDGRDERSRTSSRVTGASSNVTV